MTTNISPRLMPRFYKSSWLLMLGLVLISGNSIIISMGPQATYIGALVLLIVFGVIRGAQPIRLSELLLFFSFMIISIYHLIVFPSEIITAVIGFLVRLLIALLATRIIRNFLTTYVEVMVFLARLSLFFYLPQQLLKMRGYDLRAALAPYSLLHGDIVNIGLHNFHAASETYRNSGVFWEPGAFAGYLLIGIIFLATQRHFYSLREYRFRATLLFIGLITTQSTTGYLLALLGLILYLPSFSFFYFLLRPKVFLSMVIVGVIIFFASQWAWNKFPFLSQKVTRQFSAAREKAHGWEINRFGNFVYDWKFIKERPILGWSPHPITRKVGDPKVFAGQGNGLTGFASKFGILGLLIFITATYKALLGPFRNRRIHATLAVILILLLLCGEQFLNYPLFLSLMFITSSQMS